MAQQRRVTATDFSIFGSVDANGTLQALDTQQAIENAFRMWMVSSQGEIIRNPRRGGFLIPWVTKPLTVENAQKIRVAILNGLEQDFVPYIQVTSLTVSPNYESRRWDIDLKGYCPDYKIEVSTTTSLKSAGV